MSAMQTFWSESSGAKRAGIAVGIGAILIFLVGATIWLLRADYQVLFSGMDPRDAATVVNELERMKIDYRLADGGTRIVVPGEVVHQVRLKLMGSEMPIAGTVGLEIFNDSDFGMTEFAQKINFQRALQGELTRTIISLDEVKYARVHLVMPESGLFKSHGKDPSASVTLFLQHGKIPGERIISGIQRLVASSVPELEAEMVTVSDQRGQTLSRPPMDEMGMESISKRLQKQQEVENYYATKIRQLLAGRYGADELAVSVNVSLSYDQIRVTREGVLAEQGGVGSGVRRRRESSFDEKVRKEKGNGTKTTEVEYELGHQIEQTVEAPGRILKISVGVLVPPNLDEQQRQEIRELVSMIIGFDDLRGDAIVVSSNQYKQALTQEEAPFSVFATDPGSEGSENALLEPEADVAISPEKLSDFEEIFGIATKNPKLFALIGVVSLSSLLLVAWVVSLLRKESDAERPPELSQTDREKLLAQIKDWLAYDERRPLPQEVKT